MTKEITLHKMEFAEHFSEELIGCEEPHRMMRANLYKCGDKTIEPHFLSWSPIDTPTPNFHSPSTFGVLRLD